MKIDLSGNVKTVGSVFFTGSRNPQYGRRLVQRLITVEMEEPWRRGTGWGILLAPNLVVGLGSWQPDPAPNMATEAREALEYLDRIPRWTKVATLTLGDEKPSGLPSGWTIIPMESR